MPAGDFFFFGDRGVVFIWRARVFVFRGRRRGCVFGRRGDGVRPPRDARGGRGGDARGSAVPDGGRARGGARRRDREGFPRDFARFDAPRRRFPFPSGAGAGGGSPPPGGDGDAEIVETFLSEDEEEVNAPLLRREAEEAIIVGEGGRAGGTRRGDEGDGIERRAEEGTKEGSEAGDSAAAAAAAAAFASSRVAARASSARAASDARASARVTPGVCPRGLGASRARRADGPPRPPGALDRRALRGRLTSRGASPGVPPLARVARKQDRPRQHGARHRRRPRAHVRVRAHPPPGRRGGGGRRRPGVESGASPRRGVAPGPRARAGAPRVRPRHQLRRREPPGRRARAEAEGRRRSRRGGRRRRSASGGRGRRRSRGGGRFGRGKRGDGGVAAGALGGVRVRGLARARRARGPRRGVLRPFRRAVHRGDDGRVPVEPGPPRARRRLLGRAGAAGPGERAKIAAVARDAGLRARQPRREVRVRGVPARKGPGALRRDARVPRTHRRPRPGPPREPAHVAALRTERVAHRHTLPPHRRGLDRVGPRRRAIPRRGRTTTRGIGIFGDLLRIFPPGPAAARDGGG